jgi:hypothetical protein
MDIFKYLDVEYSFNNRPQYYSPDLNVERGLTILTLILKICCRHNRSSFNRIQVLSWAIRSNKSRLTFERILRREIKPEDIIIRHEPWLNRALDIALAEDLIQNVNGDRFQLTNRGDGFSQQIINDDFSFSEEKNFLLNVKRQVTENNLEDLVKAVTNI